MAGSSAHPRPPAARRLVLTAGNALAPGVAPLLLGRARLGLAMLALAAALALAGPLLRAWLPPLDWAAWGWHLARYGALLALSLTSLAWLLGLDRARAGRRAPLAPVLGAALFAAAHLGVGLLDAALNAPGVALVRMGATRAPRASPRAGASSSSATDGGATRSGAATPSSSTPPTCRRGWRASPARRASSPCPPTRSASSRACRSWTGGSRTGP